MSNIYYVMIDQDNKHLPFDISINADVGTVLEYYDDDLTGVSNQQFYNNYGAGFTFSSKTALYKVSQDLLGGISLKIMAKRFHNLPEDFYFYFIGFENTLYSKFQIDLKYKQFITSIYRENDTPLELIFSENPIKVYTYGVNVAFLFPM